MGGDYNEKNVPGRANSMSKGHRNRFLATLYDMTRLEVSVDITVKGSLVFYFHIESHTIS